MENSFISYLLFFCLAILLIMYLNQNMNKKCNKHNSNNSNNSNNPIVIQNNPHNPNIPDYFNTPAVSNYDTCKNKRTSGMPVHRVGPAINFHQHFTKYTNNSTYNTVKGCGIPTGIPELGWRNMYLSNYSKNEIPHEDSFSGISTRNYLDSMENVDNIYRKCF